MIENGATDWDDALNAACQGEHLELVKLMIENGATDWDAGLCSACQGGHLHLAEMMIGRGANDWNGALYYACKNRQILLARFMIQKNALDIKYLSIENVYWLLEHGTCIENFQMSSDTRELLESIKLFRKTICAFTLHLLIPDLLNLVAEYSLK